MKERLPQHQTIMKVDKLLDTPIRRLAFEAAAAILTTLYSSATLFLEAMDSRTSFRRLFRYANDLFRTDLEEQQVRDALYRLISRKLVKRQENGLMLTETGVKRAQYYLLQRLELPAPPEKWDERWRVIVFDIPEEYRFLRRVLRTKLRQFGFLNLQKSVWLYPYPCEIVLHQLIQRLELSRYVTIVVAHSISGSEYWLKRFQLEI